MYINFVEEPTVSRGTYGSPYDPLPFLYGLFYGLFYGFLSYCHKGILMGYLYRWSKKNMRTI